MLINLLVIAARAGLRSRCRGRIRHWEPLQVSTEAVGKGKQHPPTLPGDQDPVQTPAPWGRSPSLAPCRSRDSAPPSHLPVSHAATKPAAHPVPSSGTGEPGWRGNTSISIN